MLKFFLEEETGTGSIEILATNDKYKNYAGHMLSRIRYMASNQEFRKEGMVAWY